MGLHHHLLIRSGGDDDALTAVVVGRSEEVETRLGVLGMNTEKVNQGMSKEIRQDTLIPLTTDLAPEIGTLLAKLWREVDEEWDLYRPWYQCVAHQFGIVFVEEGIAVVGEIDDEGILVTIALDDLVDDVVGIEETIRIACYDLVLPFILSLGQTFWRCEGSRYKESW